MTLCLSGHGLLGPGHRPVPNNRGEGLWVEPKWRKEESRRQVNRGQTQCYGEGKHVAAPLGSPWCAAPSPQAIRGPGTLLLSPRWYTEVVLCLALDRAFPLQSSWLQPCIDFHLSQTLLKSPRGSLHSVCICGFQRASCQVSQCLNSWGNPSVTFSWMPLSRSPETRQSGASHFQRMAVLLGKKPWSAHPKATPVVFPSLFVLGRLFSYRLYSHNLLVAFIGV